MDDYSNASLSDINTRIAEIDAQLAKIDATQTDVSNAPKTEGCNLGFMERHGLRSEAATGRDFSDNEGLAASIVPFYSTGTEIWASRRQKMLDEALKTGEVPSELEGSDLSGLQGLSKEWDASEGAKYDLYQRALKGDTDADYSPIYAKKFNAETCRYVVDRNENGQPYLDGRYATPREEARKAYIREMAQAQIADIAHTMARSQAQVDADTAAWYDPSYLAYLGTNALGYAGEYAAGGVVAKGALASTKFAGAYNRLAQEGLKGAIKNGNKVRYLGKVSADIATPMVASAIKRYENLTADDYRMDENGNLYLAQEAIGGGKAAVQAAAGAAGEAYTEAVLGEATGLIVKKTLGAVAKGVYNKVPGVKKLFDTAASKMGDGTKEAAKKAYVNWLKSYARVKNSAYFSIAPDPGEFLEEYIQGVLDEVVGLDTRDASENRGLGEFTRNFFDWDANGKDLFFGILGQSIIMGGGAHAMNRTHDFKNSVDAKVLGTLKLHGYTNADIAAMGMNKRLSLANDLSRGRATKDMGYTFADYARFKGVNEREIEQYVENCKTASDEEAFAKLTPEQQAKVKADILQFNSIVYSSASIFEKGLEGATEFMKHLDKKTRKFTMLLEERQGLGNARQNVGTKASDFQSRVDWTGSTDEVGNLNWQTDEKTGRQYLESRPLSDNGLGVRIFREVDQFRVVHPQGANQNGYLVGDLKEAHDFAASLDQFAQKKNRDREIMRDYVKFNAQRLVPTKKDKKTGEILGAPVVVVNDAQDALDNLDWLTDSDRRRLQNSILDGTEGGGYVASDGTVLMMVDNLRDTNDALLTLAHELGGHMAIAEGAKGKNLSLTDVIAEVFKTSKNKNENAAQVEYGIRRKEGDSKEHAREVAQEEGMVYGNEYRMPVASPLQQAKTAIKVWMKQRGMDAKLTDADYDALAAAGLRRIRTANTGNTNTDTVMGEEVDVTPTAQGTDLQNKYLNAQWIGDYYAQREKLDAARAELDAREAAQRHAAEQLAEQEKAARRMADEEERSKRLAELEQMRKDAEHATQYGREMVRDVLIGWYGQKASADGEKKTLVNRILDGANDAEIRTLLDYIELEMDGKASEGAVLEIAKQINADIVKRTVTPAQQAQREAFAKRTNEERKARIAAENALMYKFIETVQQNPNSALAFWIHNGRRLFAYPGYKRVANKGKGNGFEFRFTGADNAIDALNEFFGGMHGSKRGDEREKWVRLIFGKNAKPGEGDSDVAMSDWIRFKKRGVETMADVNNELTDEEIMADEDFGRAENLLDAFKKEYAAYEEWLEGGQLTAEEQRERDEIQAEQAAMDELSAEIADAEEAWADAVGVTADGKPITDPAQVKATDAIEIGGLRLAVAQRTDDLVKCEADDGFGTQLAFKWNKETGGWDYVEEGEAAQSGGQDRDRSARGGLAERQDTERDAGRTGTADGADGGTAEAPSADTENFALKSATQKEIAKEQERIAQQREIERRKDAPLKGGTGEIGQSLMDLGGAEGEDLFNRTATEIRNAAKGEGGVKGAWRRLQDAGFKHRTEDEFVRSLREDKFADGETKKVGAQSIVYRAGDRVVKFRDVDGDVEDAVKKIEEFNRLFPDMAYTIRRETMTDNGGKERLIIEQPYVDALPNSGTAARRQLVAQLQERFGAENVQTHGDINEKNLLAPKSWFRIDAGPWHIEDLKDLNLGIDKRDGKVKVWDAEIAYDAAKDAEGKAQGKWRRTITPEMDAAYLDAVKLGDMKTARRMVREAAAKAMPNTKVVDKDGLPLVVYRGRDGRDNVLDTMEDGIHFTTSKSYADEYGDNSDYNSDGTSDRNTITTFLNIRNPLDLRDVIDNATSVDDFKNRLRAKGVDLSQKFFSPFSKNETIESVIDSASLEQLIEEPNPTLTDYLGGSIKNQGFDGIITYEYTNKEDPDYIVFSPSAIKSADPVTYDDAGNVIQLSERFNAAKDDIRWRRRTYAPDPDAQMLADIRALSSMRNGTDKMTESDRLQLSRLSAGVLARTERMMRELQQQGSISPELRDLLQRTRTGSVSDRAKGNVSAMFSNRNLSRIRELLQDAQISLNEMEQKLGVTKENSAYHQFDRNFGMIAKAMRDLERDIIEPLANEVRKNNLDLDDLNLYLLALHGAERNRMIAERSPYVLKALNDPRTKALVQGILNGTNGKKEINEKDILNISTLLGWVDKNGNRTDESKQFEKDLMGSGATTAWWNEKLGDFKKSGFDAKADGAVALIRKLTQMNRDLLVKSGRLNAAQAALWEKLSPNYVPMRSDMDMDSDIWSRWMLGGGKDEAGGSRKYSGEEYKHAYGRGTIADDPLSFAIQQYEESLGRAWDNIARQKLAELVRQNANLGKVFRYENLTPTKRAHYAKVIAILENKVANNTATADEKKKLRWYREALAADGSIPTTKVLGLNGIMHTVPTLSSIEGSGKKSTNIIAFKEDGELKFIKLGGFRQDQVEANPQLLNDVDAKRIASAVKRHNMAQLNGLMRGIRKMTGYFSALRTAFSPTFMVSNLGADNTQAMRNIYATFGVNAMGTFEHFAYHAFGAAKAVLNGQYDLSKDIHAYAKEWAENGGMIGGLAVENIKDLRKGVDGIVRRLASQKDQIAKISDLKSFWNWAKDKGADFADFAEKYNGIVEMSTRIAAYATARKNGMSVADAVSYARDITVNFNRKGTQTPWINALYAFSNATMQDIQRSIVAFAEGDYTKGSGLLAKRGAIMSVGLMFLGFMASLLGYWQDDPEDEKEGKAQWKYAKEYQKQNVLGTRVMGKTIGVPIRGLSRIPYYLGHQIYEAMIGRKGAAKLATDTMALAIENTTDFLGTGSDIGQTLIPSVARPYFEIRDNKTFTDSPMYREPLPGQEETTVLSELGRGNTSDAAKWAARTLNAITGGSKYERGAIDVQPEKIAAVWNWIFGSAGKDVANITGTAIDTATGKVFRGERDIRNIPYLSRFVRNLDENSADFYKARDKYEIALKKFNGLSSEDGNDDALRALVAENPWLSRNGSGKRWGNELKDLNGAVQKLLTVEKEADEKDREAVHQLRLKAQYQFMRRLEKAPTDDAEGVRAEKEHRRAMAPLLRSSKREQKQEQREKNRRQRLF